MGTIIVADPLITRLEAQSRGYFAVSLTNMDNSSEPEIFGAFEIAGSIANFAPAESITGWAALSNGPVWVVGVPSTATTVVAEFTDDSPVWDEEKHGWYGTGANSNHRYLFRIDKTSSTGYSNKRFLLNSGTVEVDGDVYCGKVNTGQGLTEVHLMNQNLETTDDVTFEDVTCNVLSCVDIRYNGNLTAGANVWKDQRANVGPSDMPLAQRIAIPIRNSGVLSAVYHVSVSTQTSSSTQNGETEARLYLNGSPISSVLDVTRSSGDFGTSTRSASQNVNVSAGDTIQLYGGFDRTSGEPTGEVRLELRLGNTITNVLSLQ